MSNVTSLSVLASTDHDNSKGIRDSNGRWLRGPGRKLGSRNKQSAELMKVVRAMGSRAVEKLSTALDSDERWAVELVLRYCLPSSRTIEMEGAEPDDIKQAFIDGDLTADETKAIAAAMEKLKTVADIDDLKRQVEELTALLAEQQPRK